ncbi:MAG TPA: DUF1643 domain-containing protein [Leptolyngbyaceae cyanobacterium]
MDNQIGSIIGYAEFDDKNLNKRKYRYLLGRKWNKNLPQVTFVMLNPSWADDTKSDRTIDKCIELAQSWDYGSLEVVNLFAYITPIRNNLKNVDDPIGPDNNLHIQSATQSAESIIVAWGGGRFPKIMNRNEEVLSLISCKTLYSLVDNRGNVLTKDGHPRHPRPRRGSITGRNIFIYNGTSKKINNSIL